MHAFGRVDIPPSIQLLRISSATFAVALDEYRSRWDAGLSFTDWTTVALMRERGIDHLATFDRGFAPWARIVR